MGETVQVTLTFQLIYLRYHHGTAALQPNSMPGRMEARLRVQILYVREARHVHTYYIRLRFGTEDLCRIPNVTN